MKKLNARGFTHWILPVLVIAVVGGVGAYVAVNKSSASVARGTCSVSAYPSPAKNKNTRYTFTIKAGSANLTNIKIAVNAMNQNGKNDRLGSQTVSVNKKMTKIVVIDAVTPKSLTGNIRAYVDGNPYVYCERLYPV